MTRVYVMDGGTVTLQACYTGAGKEGYVEGNIPYVYIDHPKAKIMLDTGINPETFLHGMLQTKKPPPGMEMTITQSESQRPEHYLKELKVDPSEIDYLIPTHLHDDHIGYNRLFSKATCIVQREELRHAYVPERFEQPYDKSAIDIPGLDYMCVDGDFQLFSDVELLATPGHSAGSQCIAVHLKHSGTLLFVGDLFYSLEMFEADEVPQIWWAPSMLDWVRSVDRIRAYARRTGARLFVYHDRADFHENWKQFPDFYD